MSLKSSFESIGLKKELLSALEALGYEEPTAVQAQSLPVLMSGDDLLAQAQTGTGKTAAFALPILSRCDLSLNKPQAMVIAPTRELAIQVAEAFGAYAKHLDNFHVTPIYGGQDYRIQLRSLKRGPQVIVGTPGRLLDHLQRKSFPVDAMKMVVLDEADEMLKMGFIEDIEAILNHVPTPRQTGLFSATMPATIQNIAKRYLNNPKKVMIKPCHKQAANIEQTYICVNKNKKCEVLRRYLEVENVNSAIIFVRTKMASTELSERLQSSGYAVEALNGDLNQARREKVLGRFRQGRVDLVVATDVAARGIDVEHVTHVINYDIPTDEESYIHRIGRTGRAGRQGKALLLVTPRERRLLQDIEKVIGKSIERVAPPSVSDLSEQRVRSLASSVIKIIEKSKNLGPYRQMVANLIEEEQLEPTDVAAAMAYMMQQSNPLPTEEIEAVDFSDGPVKERRRRNPRRGGPRHPAERRASKRQGKANSGQPIGSASRPKKKSKSKSNKG